MEILLISAAFTAVVLSFALGVSQTILRRLMGYMVLFNVTMHVSIMTFTAGYNSAVWAAGELSAIFITIALWFVHKAIGHERFVRKDVVETTRLARVGFRLERVAHTRPGRWYERAWVPTHGWLNKPVV